MRKYWLTFVAILAAIVAIIFARKSLPSDRFAVEQARKGLDDGQRRIDDIIAEQRADDEGLGRAKDAVEDGLGVLKDIKKGNL